MAYFAVQCDSRDNLKEYLEAHGVGTNIHYNRFSKGIFGWIGFKTKWIPYENVERVAGGLHPKLCGNLQQGVE